MEIAVNINGSVGQVPINKIITGVQRNLPLGRDVQLSAETKGLRNIPDTMVIGICPGIINMKIIIDRKTPGNIEVYIIIVKITNILAFLWCSFIGFFLAFWFYLMTGYRITLYPML